MTKIEIIKNELKKLQPKFNPEKSSYKTIEEILNNDLSIEEVFTKVKSIKGIGRLSDDLKNIYNSVVMELTNLVVIERKKKEKEKIEENTRKLKEIVEQLEKQTNNAVIDKEKEEEKIKQDLGLAPKKEEIAIEDQKEEVEELIEETKNKKSKARRTYNILIALVTLSIIAIVLILLFY